MGLSRTFLVCLVLSVTILTRVRTNALGYSTVQTWNAILKLGVAENGGTNSPINIKLYNKDGFQQTVTLNEQNIPLGKGTEHKFRFVTGFLGKLSKVELSLSIFQNPCHLETFQLKNMDTAQTYKFRVGGFFTKETFNVPQEKVKLWRIQVQVGASRDAGTRGMVQVHLHGSKGSSDIIRLRSPYHEEFIPMETIDFYFATKDIGHFESVQMVVGQWDLMYLERLLITDIDESKEFAFKYSGFVMNETFYSSKQNKNAAENKSGYQAVSDSDVKSHRLMSWSRESPSEGAILSSLPSHVTSGQSVTFRPFSLGRETKVTLDTNRYGGIYTSHRSPDDTVGNFGTRTGEILTTKPTTKPSQTTKVARIVIPTANTIIATASTTSRARTTRTRRTATSKSTTVKPIRKKFVFDSKKEASILPTSRQQMSKTSRETPETLPFSRKASSKEETNDVDIWDSVLGEAHDDFRTTTKRSPFNHLAERKRQNLGSVVKSGNARVWEPRRATSVPWKPTTKPRVLRKPTMVERPKVKVATLNENKQKLTRFPSSDVSTIERSSSDAKESQVSPKLTLQRGHGSNVKNEAVNDPLKNIQLHSVTKTASSFREATTRPISNVNPSLDIDSMASSKFPRPAEMDIKEHSPKLIEEIPSRPDHSRKSKSFDRLANEPRRNSASQYHINKNSPADLASLGQRSKVDVSLGTNVPNSGQRSRGDVSRVSVGVKTLKAGADHLTSPREGVRLDYQRPVPGLESIARKPPTPGESVRKVKVSNANNLSPNYATETQELDWTSISSNPRPDKAVIQRPRLSGGHSNQVSRKNRVEQKPFERSSITVRQRSDSVDINRSVYRPRHKGSGIGLKTRKTNNQPDSGVIEFQPEPFNDTAMIPTPTDSFEKVEGCHLAPYEDDERYYLEEVTGFTSVIRPCPISTVFRRENCACTSPKNGVQKSSKCNVEFEMDFDHGIKDSSGKNLFAPSENVLVEKSAGRFVGNSQISLWRFQQADFGDKMTIRLSFKQDGSQPEVQQLVGNCVPNHEPSISISLNQQKKTVMYRIVTHAYSETIEALYNTSSWNEVALAYNGKTMQSITNGVQKFKNLEGKIEKRGSPLKFGFCETTHGFRGLLDNVQIYMCVPGEHGAVV